MSTGTDSASDHEFHAQHSAPGAHMSFTCGHPGPCGIGLELGGPAEQDWFIGYQRGAAGDAGELRCLPFFKDARSNELERFNVAGAAEVPRRRRRVQPFQTSEWSRVYSLGKDCFRAGALRFTVYAPARSIRAPHTAEPEAIREDTLPAVVAELEYDNRAGSDVVTLFIAADFRVGGARLIERELGPGAQGAALRRELGFAGRVASGAGRGASGPGAASLFQRWDVVDGLNQSPPVHHLGTCVGLAVEVQPGQAITLELAFGVYRAGLVTTGLQGCYLYSRHYSELEEVLRAALLRHHELKELSEKQSASLASSALSAAQQFLLAHAVHSYYGSTQLLDIADTPTWIVYEGEYCMMNTLDLTVDMVFFELALNPWTVHSVLEQFASRYNYDDQCGVSFCHDMGQHGAFSRPGTSSYELAGLSDCFSYMTQEELCNWLLVAATYVAHTGDAAWAERRGSLVSKCFDSMRRRGPQGVMSVDSERCEGGAEITTYDSLDPSLSQARGSLYLAVKCWASYVAVALLHPQLRESAWEAAKVTMQRVLESQLDDGTLPALLEPDAEARNTRVLAAAEGLVYPTYWARHGQGEARELGRAALVERAPELVSAIAQHCRVLLEDPERRNFFADGGVRLSSTSDNSWRSKFALVEYVARDLFGFHEDASLAAKLAGSEPAQVRWQKRGSADQAFCDQLVNGQAQGSRYYPRGVSAILHVVDLFAGRN